MIKEVYGRKYYMGNEGRSREYKESSSWIWEKNEHWSEITREFW